MFYYPLLPLLIILFITGGEITLNSTNTLDPPLINPNFLARPQDLTIMLELPLPRKVCSRYRRRMDTSLADVLCIS
ncbi:hypothetical protein DFS33DRAFT_1329498 [Desarmillaria ectypa]|nr:hypothetical protein DFS33DRAFT_1329498 [Desarmillaria ectypa]